MSDPIGESTLVQSLDPTDPAVLVAGAADHVLALSGVRVVLLHLTFADLPVGVDAVHVSDADDMWVRYSTFERLGGAAVRQTAAVGDLTFENNELVEVGSILEIGCAAGGTPPGTDETPPTGGDLPPADDDLVLDQARGCGAVSAGSIGVWALLAAAAIRTRGRTSNRRTERPDRPAPTRRVRLG